MRLTARAFKSLASMLDTYSQFNPSPLSIKQFIDFGKKGCEKTSFNFLKKELPVRLANIMKELKLLPSNLKSMPSVGLVENWYVTSFKEILQFEGLPSEDPETMNKFSEALVKVRNRHSDVVQTMAQGVIELKESHAVEPAMEQCIQYFLDRFYMSRISIRMLINQHTMLFGEESNQEEHIGGIDPCCDVARVLKDAYESARFLCDRYYLASPDLSVTCKNYIKPDEDINMVYVPSHLYYMVFEIFKNSLRAVVEHHGTSATTFPNIHALVVNAEEDITIKISDKGGGIPRKDADALFQYMYTTAPQPSSSDHDSVPLAGYGYGLPISRLYARYFHGDLFLASMEGHGTDAFIYLKAISNEAEELLPIFNKTSSRRYNTSIPAADWSSTNGAGTHRSNISHGLTSRLP